MKKRPTRVRRREKKFKIDTDLLKKKKKRLKLKFIKFFKEEESCFSYKQDLIKLYILKYKCFCLCLQKLNSFTRYRNTE